MAQPHLRPQAHRQPHSKTDATFGSSSSAAGAAATPPQLSRPSSVSRHASPARSNPGTDASDRATAALVRRVLCPHVHAGSTEPRPINELLPPLTSSNDIDLQLYAIIAIVVKELVYSWYGKITPDQGFVEEVVRIVAHCTRALEGRMRAVDLEALIFDEIPELLECHVLGQCKHSQYNCQVINTNRDDTSISSKSPTRAITIKNRSTRRISQPQSTSSIVSYTQHNRGIDYRGTVQKREGIQTITSARRSGCSITYGRPGKRFS